MLRDYLKCGCGTMDCLECVVKKLETDRFIEPFTTAEALLGFIEPHYRYDEQNDAFEVLCWLLRQIQAPLLDQKITVQLTTTIKCTNDYCLYTDINDEKTEPHLSLAVNGHDVQTCLENYSKEQLLQDYACEFCGMRGTSLISHTLQTDKFLMIRLKIFDNHQNKLKAPFINQKITVGGKKLKMIGEVVHEGSDIDQGHFFGKKC